MKSTKQLAWELGLLRKRTSSSVGKNIQKLKKTCQLFSHLIVIDFESTCWQDGKHRTQEIIEFPAVLLNTSTGDIESEFHYYIQPQESPILSDFCKQLTGITQEQVEQGISLSVCLKKFSAWLKKISEEGNFVYNTSENPMQKRCTFVTWSDWDLAVCLHYEVTRKQIRKPPELTSWIDLRATYRSFYDRRPNGLNGALQDLGITFEGREHSGLCDARNTAKLAWRMMCDGCIMKITKSTVHSVSSLNQCFSTLKKYLSKPQATIPKTDVISETDNCDKSKKIEEVISSVPATVGTSNFEKISERSKTSVIDKIKNAITGGKIFGKRNCESQESVNAPEQAISTQSSVLKPAANNLLNNGKGPSPSSEQNKTTTTQLLRHPTNELLVTKSSRESPANKIGTLRETDQHQSQSDHKLKKLGASCSNCGKVEKELTVFHDITNTKQNEATSEKSPHFNRTESIQGSFKSGVKFSGNIERPAYVSGYSENHNTYGSGKSSIFKVPSPVSHQSETANSVSASEPSINNRMSLSSHVNAKNKTGNFVLFNTPSPVPSGIGCVHNGDDRLLSYNLKVSGGNPCLSSNTSKNSSTVFKTPSPVISTFQGKNTSSGSPYTPSPQISCMSSRQSFGMNASHTSSSTLMKRTPPLCQCGRRTVRKIVQSPGPNLGRPFYCCPLGRKSSGGPLKKKKEGCGYFKWEVSESASPQFGSCNKDKNNTQSFGKGTQNFKISEPIISTTVPQTNSINTSVPQTNSLDGTDNVENESPMQQSNCDVISPESVTVAWNIGTKTFSDKSSRLPQPNFDTPNLERKTYNAKPLSQKKTLGIRK